MRNVKRVKGDSYYGKMAQIYQKKRERTELWPVEQEAMAKILDGLPNGLKVLDMPFGTGRFVPFFLEHDYEIHGLDASDEMLKQAKVELGDETYSKCHLKRGFSTDLPYADKEFDLVVSVRFLRDIIHFGPGKKTLDEFARVTKSHAIIQLGQQIDETDDYPADDERMGSRMTAKEVEKLLDTHGFEIQDKVRVTHTPAENSEIFFFVCNVKP